MKTYFNRIQCDHCFQRSDVKNSHCPNCGEELNNPDAGLFLHHVKMPFWKEIIFVLLSLVLLRIVATVIQVVQMTNLIAQGYDTKEALNEQLMLPENLIVVEFVAYGIFFAACALLLWDSWKDVLKSFKGWKPYVFGVAGAAAIMGVEFFYNLIITVIFTLVGTEYGSNANQSVLVTLIDYTPVLSLIFFGLIGPFCEECGYRVGLFGLGTRFGKVLGYVIACLVFGLIHFDFQTAFTPTVAAAREWANLPIYIFSGAAFCFLYDKFGFGCSFVAHAANNCYSIIQIIILRSLPQ